MSSLHSLVHLEYLHPSEVDLKKVAAEVSVLRLKLRAYDFSAVKIVVVGNTEGLESLVDKEDKD